MHTSSFTGEIDRVRLGFRLCALFVLYFESSSSHMRLCVSLTITRMKTEQNSCVIVKFNAILGVLTIYENYAKNI